MQAGFLHMMILLPSKINYTEFSCLQSHKSTDSAYLICTKSAGPASRKIRIMICLSNWKRPIQALQNMLNNQRKGAYAESISTGPESTAQLSVTPLVFLRTYRYNRRSSTNTVPVPPAAGLFLVPTPIVTVLTLARFTPAKSCRSMTHSFHPVICVAAGST